MDTETPKTMDQISEELEELDASGLSIEEIRDKGAAIISQLFKEDIDVNSVKEKGIAACMQLQAQLQKIIFHLQAEEWDPAVELLSYQLSDTHVTAWVLFASVLVALSHRSQPSAECSKEG